MPEKIVLDWQCAVLEYLFDKRLERFALNNLMMASDSPYLLDEFMDKMCIRDRYNYSIYHHFAF